MRWATRAGVHIDRAACAWLIRRFIDPEAKFVFVADPDEVPAEATPFDMRGAELSHHQGDCSFEQILRRYHLEDPVLWDLARIVHEADLADERYDAPEAPGLDVLLRGLSMGHCCIEPECGAEAQQSGDSPSWKSSKKGSNHSTMPMILSS
jgi:hypothetical protein